MGGNVFGQTATQTYSSQHIRRVIEQAGITVASETWHDLLLLCPYHRNESTPSLSISKSNGKFICFNPACGERGTILDIVKHTKNLNDFEAMRFIINVKPTQQEKFEDELSNILKVEDDFIAFDQSKIRQLADALPGSPGERYMLGRGFTKETLNSFVDGYSEKMDMVDVPVYAHNGIPVGIIGRSVTDKRFKNSMGLPSAKVFFNMNRAMRASATAIVVEAAFDAMKVHQAGYPNVIATIGGHISPYKFQLLNRYFDKVIIMTDNDKPQYRGICRPCDGVCRGHNPGRELGLSIAENFDREVEWAQWSDTEVYPDNAKDAGDMTEDQIRKILKNTVSDVEYRMLHMV